MRCRWVRTVGPLMPSISADSMPPTPGQGLAQRYRWPDHDGHGPSFCLRADALCALLMDSRHAESVRSTTEVKLQATISRWSRRCSACVRAVSRMPGGDEDGTPASAISEAHPSASASKQSGDLALGASADQLAHCPCDVGRRRLAAQITGVQRAIGGYPFDGAHHARGSVDLAEMLQHHHH